MLRYPRIYVVYWNWTSDPAGERPYLEKFLNGISGSPWLNAVTEYYDTTGHITNSSHQFKGTWSDPSALPPFPSQGATTDALFAAEAVRASNHFGYDKNSLYLLAEPHGYEPQGSCTAYHDSTVNWNQPGATTKGAVPYIVFSYISDGGATCGQNEVNPGTAGLLDQVSILAGHEVAETVTDPFPVSGWADVNDLEIGDLCEGSSGAPYEVNQKFSTGTFAVQRLYSNARGGCVLSTP
jgi:hypothetical protein